MEGSTLGKNSAELSCSVGKTEHNQGQEVWMAAGERTQVVF